MAVLSDFDVVGLMRDWRCRYLVETGTGAGKNIDVAAELPFEQIFSIEGKHAVALQAGLRFSKNQSITIIHGRNERGLAEALDDIPAAAPVLFLLGAHAPGGEFRSFTETDKDGNPRLLPVERLLRLLIGRRDIARDVLLIDDLRIYEDGSWEDGPCPDDQRPAAEYRRAGLFEDLLGGSHRLERLFRRTGYLCAYPQGRS